LLWTLLSEMGRRCSCRFGPRCIRRGSSGWSVRVVDQFMMMQAITSDLTRLLRKTIPDGMFRSKTSET
jgi:hypothetical protein